MRRLSRTLFAFLLFAGLFAAGCAMAFTAARAQDNPKPVVPEWTDNRPPGPDELFAPLPAEGLFEGKAPAAFHKAVILDVPFEDSWNDDPVDDLPPGSQLGARAYRYHLEQQLDYIPTTFLYLPQHDTGNYLRRTARFQARLRFTAGFSGAKAPEAGAKSEGLEAAAKCFGADIVFATAYSRGDSPRALCVRYRRGSGVEAAHEFALAASEGKPLVETLPVAAARVCAGVQTVKGPDGKAAEFVAAPVPPIATSDEALLRCVNLRQALETNGLRRGWIEYEDLKKLEPPSGRAATWAMEIFRGLADSGNAAADRDKYLAMCLETARLGLKQAPNDTLLRGKMCRYAAIWFKRDAWSLAGIRQAMRVQPANAHLLDWHSLVEHATSRPKQAQWLLEVALPLLPDGRGAFLVANSYFEGGRYAEGVEYYNKAIALAPNEHEYRFAAGLCGTYMAEQLERVAAPGPAGAGAREQALDAFASAAESLIAAQRLDPCELGWAYDYHVRTATHNFTSLPANPATLERVMLSQAVSTTLEPTSRTFKWDRLAAPLLDTYRRLLRRQAREAVQTDPDYELWLMVRLQFALADKALDEATGNREEILATLRLMRKFGHRSDYYRGAMAVYGVLLDAAPPKDSQDKKD